MHLTIKLPDDLKLRAAFLAAASVGTFMVNAFFVVVAVELFGEPPQTPDPDDRPVLQAILVIIISPLLETALLVALLRVIHIFTSRKLLASLVSATIWALAHAHTYLLWAAPGFSGFFIYTYLYLSLKEQSAKVAFTSVAAIHAGNNSLVLIIEHLLSGS